MYHKTSTYTTPEHNDNTVNGGPKSLNSSTVDDDQNLFHLNWRTPPRTQFTPKNFKSHSHFLNKKRLDQNIYNDNSNLPSAPLTYEQTVPQTSHLPHSDISHILRGRQVRKRSMSLPPSPPIQYNPNKGFLFTSRPNNIERKSSTPIKPTLPPSRDPILPVQPTTDGVSSFSSPSSSPNALHRLKKLPSFIKYMQLELNSYITDGEDNIADKNEKSQIVTQQIKQVGNSHNEEARKNMYNILYVPVEMEKVSNTLLY